MNCPNCNFENKTESKFCESCGIKLILERDVDVNPIQPRAPMTKKKKLLLVCAAVIVIGVFILVSLISKLPPSKDEVKQALITAFFVDRDEKITDFALDSRSTDHGLDYAYVTVTCSNSKVEHTEKYIVTHQYADDWILIDVQPHEEESWCVVPLTAPTAEECLEDIKADYYGYYNYDTEYGYYDSFLVSKEQKENDVASGIITYIYDVQKESCLRRISGSIEVVFIFNEEDEKWEYDSCENLDNYKEEFVSNTTWKGIIENKNNNDTNLVLKLTEFTKEKLTVEVIYNGGTYTFSQKNEVSGYDHSESEYIEAYSHENEKFYLDGRFDEDETFSGSLYIDYDPDDYWIWERDYYDLDLTLEK